MNLNHPPIEIGHLSCENHNNVPVPYNIVLESLTPNLKHITNTCLIKTKKLPFRGCSDLFSPRKIIISLVYLVFATIDKITKTWCVGAVF